MAIDSVRRSLDFLLGQTNAQQLKRYEREMQHVGSMAEDVAALSDDALRAKTSEFRERLASGETKQDLRAEAFAVVREVAERAVGLRPFDVQILGAIALDEHRIAEMQTGEGKTLVATLPAYLNALVGKVHVVTVNDYLARRDREWMGPIYESLGLSVGLLQEDSSPEERQAGYACDITYGTNNQFGFDYLRDNMVLSSGDKVQGPLDFAIVDEIDNILIDEARTPLIISGSTAESYDLYKKFASLVRRFRRDEDFEIDEESKRLTLTDEGIHKAESDLRVPNLFSPEHAETLHSIENALRALHMFTKEQHYIVKDDRVMIVDEFTGRLMPDRRYSDGLHQAIEAKEGLTIQRESQTLATITLQHYFQLYRGLCGMTGTAKTEEDEFKQIYALPVLEIPTNRPLRREPKPDTIFRTRKAKYEAIADEIARLHEQGRPVLVGTNSIEKSELISHLLKARKLPHTVLNAKYHEKEAEIVAEAGQRGAITVATNMAGRGTDIKLGEGVADIGGLHVIGCQRHESRRIDNQLLGRAGRQGDPGSSQFYLSLEDDLLRIFGGERIGQIMDRIGMKEGEAIEHTLLTGAIRRAQKRVEGRNFEIRKRLLEYDLVLAKQREAIYALRDRFLLPPRQEGRTFPEGAEEDLAEYLHDLFEEFAETLVATYAHKDRPPDEWNLDGLTRELSTFGSVDDAAWRGARAPELASSVVDHLDRALVRQRERIGEPFAFVGRYLILMTLDEAWRTHLYTLDDLKGGIGWTAYAGTDPLVAFKRESFVLFQEMLASTAEKIVRMLLNPRLSITENGATTTSTAPRQPVRLIHAGQRPAPLARPEAPAPDARRPVHVP
ncbi:MAG: preprotein translocase subunit SecA, partial [Candidatus Bipolaricaulis sp.]|nr:preprotein translocase subunit SecA [Candidatus Bipolaricaulis sp.]